MANWVKKIGKELGTIDRKRKTRYLGQPKGKGWKTMREFMEQFGHGDNKTRKIIRQAILDNEVEVFDGSDLGVTGRLTRQTWYRFKNGKYS